MDNIIQGSPEWHKLRLGKVTASKIADLTAKTKSGWAASRANYMSQLLCERLTGNPTEYYTNGAMQWGTDCEPQARAAYTLHTDNVVTEVSFIDHPYIPMTGASPDGLVGEDGLIEIKCPNTATHIDTLLGAEVDGKYIKQMQWQMACTGRKWADFVSFDPRLPLELQIKIIRVDRHDAMIKELEGMVIEFLAELETKHDSLSQMKEAA